MHPHSPALSRIAATLFVTVAALSAISSAGTFGLLSQPRPNERESLISRLEGDTHHALDRMGECAVAFPCYLHSLTRQGLPIDHASQHVSSGFAVDEDWLRLIPTSVTFMAFNFLCGSRMSAAAIAAGALVSACGGGGGGAEPDTSEATTASSSSSGVVASSSETSSSASQLGTTSTVSTTSNATDGAATSVVASTSPTAGLGASETGATTVTETTTVATAAPTSGVPTSTAGSAAGKRSSVALNLGELTYYSPEIPTIDAMKRAGAWLTQCSTTCGAMTAGASAWDTLEESALDLDANGWIKSLPASGDATHKYRSATTVLSANGALPLGRYIVRYDGAGSITYSGFTKSTTSTAGRDVVDLTTTGNAWMTITATNPSNYLRNIRIYMPGGACANDLSVYAATADACNSTTGTYVAFESFPTTQIWHPLFLQDVKGFRALRFMDWNLTNATQVTSWSQRTLPTARTWAAASGAPVEAILDLANYIGADAWMNVPPHADDNYAAQMGVLAASHLTNGTSKLDLEYANEPGTSHSRRRTGCSRRPRPSGRRSWPAASA